MAKAEFQFRPQTEGVTDCATEGLLGAVSIHAAAKGQPFPVVLGRRVGRAGCELVEL